MANLDFSTAPPQSSSDVIPDRTQARIVLAFIYGDVAPDNELHRTKSGLHMLKLEATVIEPEQYAKRKFWPQYILGGDSQLTAGQQQAVDISRRTIRAILENARGISPTDDSERAISARKLRRFADLDGMEIDVLIGVEKGRDGYDDKNVIRRVGKPRVADAAARPATAQQARRAAWA